jgi:hypothetical protein
LEPKVLKIMPQKSTFGIFVMPAGEFNFFCHVENIFIFAKIKGSKPFGYMNEHKTCEQKFAWVDVTCYVRKTTIQDNDTF